MAAKAHTRKPDARRLGSSLEAAVREITRPLQSYLAALRTASERQSTP